MKRTASAVWSGDLKTGKGTMSTQTGVLKDARYGFASRFEEGPGSNPEELIGAAHAGCFSMAFSADLATAGHVPTSVATTATVTLEFLEAGPTITSVHLETRAVVPGIDAATFQTIAAGAKAGCPISRLLNTTITLNAVLAS